MNLDEQFAKALKLKERNYGKLVQLQKKLFDAWALTRFKEEGYSSLKMANMAFLMNIEDGITNKDLAMKVHITKQAMSKGIKELEKLNLVTTGLHETDARMSLISLTEEGKRVVIYVVENVCEKMEEYEKLVGKERFRQAMDTMFEILDYEKSKFYKGAKTKS